MNGDVTGVYQLTEFKLYHYLKFLYEIELKFSNLIVEIFFWKFRQWLKSPVA